MKISTKKYVDNQVKWEGRLRKAEVKAIRQAVDKVEATNKEAVCKVESTYADYRKQQNEWRQQLRDQAGSFVTRRELWGAVITTITILLAAIALINKM